MDIVKNPRVDWVGLKWVFTGISLVLLLVGLLSLSVRGLNLGIDFTGGTLVYAKFKEQPELDRIRQALGRAGLQAEQVSTFGDVADQEVQIRMASIEAEEAQDLTLEAQRVVEALRQYYATAPPGEAQLDLNSVFSPGLSEWLQERDPENRREELSITEYVAHYDAIAGQIIDVRTRQGGILRDLEPVGRAGVSQPVMQVLQEQAYLGDFTVISVESVGPRIGREMQERARNAILFSLLGMLIYIAFRFKPIYGLAAIVAIFHDVFITVGIFSLANKEISLTVIAALLTLVGYSINDTIVIFDRVRENVRGVRKTDWRAVFNLSINQTLNRTIMTSGATFVAVMALYLVGGEALSGFSFALVIGIIIGTYSSVSVASPIVLWWMNYQERRKAAARA